MIDASAWQTIDFISDLHLQVAEPATAKAWFDYMASPEQQADAIFILGDWFEVWVGDDDEDPFVALCAAVMRQRAKGVKGGKPCELFIMHGNRDFLMGADLAERSSATLLADPTRLDFNGTSYLLTHGDALCSNDVSYMRFRELVRAPEWQAEFLAKPLEERKNIARQIRAQSQAQHGAVTHYADINEALALEWLNTHGCDVMIHGHTHQAATHPLGHGQRHVLSDWDASASPKRLEVLRLTTMGLQRLAL
ncbi:MAG: UDP-2,3-diacylglucosamine diphosphatase [Cytophagales bacterium]|nr:UDP-2,3-diacylglucosamine diphosphatase [Cytophagales bacterium]